MGNLLAYSGLVTKVRAMSANLLTEENFDDITGLPGVVEIVRYLRKFPAYEEAFESLEDDQLHRGNIEKVMVQSLYKDYTKLYRFSGIEHRKFLKLYLKSFEVDLINYCLGIIFNHYEEPFDLNHKKAFFDRYSSISINKLITSENLYEFVENLKDTEYYEPLKKLRESSNATLFDYELVLDLHYYTALWKEKKKVLSKKELEIFTRETGTKIDLLNLQWIYRSKKYYTIHPADIYALLIPIHYHIKQDTLKTMAETASLDEFIAEIKKSYYGRRYHLELGSSIEHLYSECLYHLYMSDQRREPYSIATMNTYLFLRQEELKRITTIMECVRYGLGPREIKQYTGGGIQP